MTVFHDDWSNVGDLIRDFQIEKSDLDGAEILFAGYQYEHYSGQAFVLFKRAGKLWEVNATHCSCFGLEEQWEPEEAHPKAILHRLRSSWGVLERGKDMIEAAVKKFAIDEMFEI